MSQVSTHGEIAPRMSSARKFMLDLQRDPQAGMRLAAKLDDDRGVFQVYEISDKPDSLCQCLSSDENMPMNSLFV
jgi:hypothetical protein